MQESSKRGGEKTIAETVTVQYPRDRGVTGLAIKLKKVMTI